MVQLFSYHGRSLGRIHFHFGGCQYFVAASHIGDRDPSTIRLNKEEEAIQGKLLACVKKDSKVQGFSTWVSLFHPTVDSELQQHELAAFLLGGLSRYVLPGCPDRGVTPSLVPMAIKLSKGTKYLLGPLYLVLCTGGIKRYCHIRYRQVLRKY